jgi:hypothetical protein
MSIISLFCGSYCNGQEVVRKLVDHTGYRLVEDTEVAASAATISGLSESKIARAFSDKTSVFNSFTH